MTESEWLTSNDPVAMLRLVHENPDHQSITCTRSDRKLRLFACACCREAGRPLDYTLLEEFGEIGGMPDLQWAEGWAKKGLEPSGNRKAALLREIFGNPFQSVWVRTSSLAQLESEGKLVRHVPKKHPLGGFAEAFAPLNSIPVRIFDDLAWFAHENGRVSHLAQSIYDDRAFDRLPILADALEEAGCTDAAILDHCRGQELCPYCRGTGMSKASVNGDIVPWGCGQCNGGEISQKGTGRQRHFGPHVRGCWVVDLLLGKE